MGAELEKALARVIAEAEEAEAALVRERERAREKEELVMMLRAYLLTLTNSPGFIDTENHGAMGAAAEVRGVGRESRVDVQ